jgi:hypothetical protein
MKYNSTISFSAVRPGLVMSRKKFYVLMAVLTVVFGGCYWFYLHQLTHVGGLRAQRIFSELSLASRSTPIAAPATPVVPALKTPVVSPVVQTPALPAPVAKPAIPQTEAFPVAVKPVAAAPVNRVIVGKGMYMQLPPLAASAQKSTLQRQTQAFTDPNPLLQAGNLAFANLIDMANSHLDACGFLPDDILQNARLGDPIPVYQIAAADRAHYQAGQPVKPLLKPAERWMFPVFIGPQIRCMIQVTHTGHNYVPGGPSKILGVTWSKILEKWPAAEGFHPQLIVNPEMPGYYFSVPELAEQNITDTDQMIYSSGELSPAAVIMASWR